MNKGYYGIGIECGKTKENIGVLFRSALLFGASFVFTIGKRYPDRPEDRGDTYNSWKHIPLYNYEKLEDLKVPENCKLVGVELCNHAKDIRKFVHPKTAIYLLGAEDRGLSREATIKCDQLIYIPMDHSMNVAACGSIICYDRFSKTKL